jgi:hypothetical protein
MTLQVAALADGAATNIRCDLSAQAFILFHLDAGGRLLAASGFGPGNTIARTVHAHSRRRVFINRNKRSSVRQALAVTRPSTWGEDTATKHIRGTRPFANQSA